MAKLTAAERNKLGSGQFAIPSKRAYPIHDISHARNALARAAGKSEEAQVKAAVHKKYPQIDPGESKENKKEEASESKAQEAAEMD